MQPTYLVIASLLVGLVAAQDDIASVSADGNFDVSCPQGYTCTQHTSYYYPKYQSYGNDGLVAGNRYDSDTEYRSYGDDGLIADKNRGSKSRGSGKKIEKNTYNYNYNYYNDYDGYGSGGNSYTYEPSTAAPTTAPPTTAAPTTAAPSARPKPGGNRGRGHGNGGGGLVGDLLTLPIRVAAGTVNEIAGTGRGGFNGGGLLGGLLNGGGRGGLNGNVGASARFGY